jgi:dihydrofolate reductase
MGAAIGATMAQSDALMMGRVNYEAWVMYWPAQSSDNQFAAYMNTTPKFVVSTTLDTVEWNNSTLINGDVMDKIAKLKQQPGKNISISGSGTLVQSLLHHNLLDELHLMVHPLVVGSGKHLFTDEGEHKALTLNQCTNLQHGCGVSQLPPCHIRGVS